MATFSFDVGDDTFVYMRDGSANAFEEFGSIYVDAAADGAQEVPPVTTSASGSGSLRLNKAQDELNFEFSESGLDLTGSETCDPGDDVTGLHIHRAPAGSNGAVVFGVISPSSDSDGDTVIAGSSASGQWDAGEGNGTTLTAELSNLLSDGLYVNFHTAAFPSGEIRGQITRLDDGDDRIDVTALNVASLIALRNVLEDDGDGDAELTTRLDSVATTLTLLGVSVGDLDAGDFIFERSATNDSIGGNNGRDDLFGGRGNDGVFGGRGADQLFGGGGDDDVRGGGGRDLLDGGGGDDILRGGGGSDELIDGVGADILFGQNGSDIFRMVGDGARDVIRDFENDVDDIGIHNATFGDLTIRDVRPGTVRVVHDGDVIIVRDGAAGTLMASDLKESDFIFD